MPWGLRRFHIHRNPVKRGLCERPEDWQWSSFRHYRTGMEGVVEIESDGRRTSGKGRREGSARYSNCPLKPEAGLNGPPAFTKGAVLQP